MSERSRARFSCSCPRSETKEKGSDGGHGDTGEEAVHRSSSRILAPGSWLIEE